MLSFTWHFWFDIRTKKDKHIKISNSTGKWHKSKCGATKSFHINSQCLRTEQDRTGQDRGVVCLHWVGFPFWERDEIMVSPGPSNQQSVSPAGDVAAPPVIWFYFIHEPHPVIAHPKKCVVNNKSLKWWWRFHPPQDFFKLLQDTPPA